MYQATAWSSPVMSYQVAMLCAQHHAHDSTFRAQRMQTDMHQVNTQGLIQVLPVMM